MPTNRVALLEDNPRMAAIICKALTAAGIQVDVFERIESARRAIAPQAYAALVIDRSVPDGDGLDLVRRLRTQGDATPCLMVTARDALHDRIHGLESGADDYLPKPFSLEELVARVRALMRRPATLASLAPTFGGITVHPDKGCMTFGGQPTPLPPAELQILLALVHAAGELLRRSRLEAAGWGYATDITANALDVAIHRLRRKLATAGAPVRIVNHRGQGFALHATHEAQ